MAATKNADSNTLVWDYLSDEPEGRIKIVETLIIIGSYILLIITLPISIFFAMKMVNQYQKAVIFRLGVLQKGTKGPGLVFILPCVDIFKLVDVRTVTFNLPPQEVLTKDSCTVYVTAVLYYLIENPIKVVGNAKNYKLLTSLLACTTLRNVMGQKSLAEILTERKVLSQTISKNLHFAMERWGINIERVEIVDVKLPEQMKRVMAAEAEAHREARAKEINAEGELQSAKTLIEAARIMSKNSIALQLRYLQTLTTVAADKNKTIMFPMPAKFRQ